jgi:hypothetical protein
MDYIVRIKPIEAFGTIATRLHIRLFYVLFGSNQTCFLEYKTFDGQSMYTKNLVLPDSLVAKWGTNDDLILQYIVKVENVTIDDSPVFMVDEQAQLQTKEKLATPTEVDYQTTSEIVDETIASQIVPPLNTNV